MTIFNRRSLVVAAFPKSGSQHLIALLNSIAKQTKFVNRRLCKGYGHSFLKPQHIPNLMLKNLIVYGHVPATGHNIKVIKKRLYRPSCLILIRPLPDIVVSLADHINKNARSPLDYNVPGLVDGFSGTLTQPISHLYDQIISFTLPWYIQFLCSWIHGKHNLPLDISTFEEHVNYPALSVSKILDFSGITAVKKGVSELENFENIKKTNFNKGISGRGNENLTNQQLMRIIDLVNSTSGLQNTLIAKYLVCGYSGLDFSELDVIEHKNLSSDNKSFFLDNQPTINF